jgi:hypothetical protein
MPRVEPQAPEPESDSIAITGTFVERTDKVITVVPDAAGLGSDVMLVFRQEIDAAARRRCFFCVLRGDQINCIEVDCKRTRPVPPSA